MVHDLSTFTIVQSGGIAGAKTRFFLDNVKILLRWCLMAGQADGHENSLLNVKIESTLSVCRKFGHCKNAPRWHAGLGSIKK